MSPRKGKDGYRADGHEARPDQPTISTISDHTAITQLRLEHGAFKYRRPLRLGPRGACAALPNCPQVCNGFVSENPDGSPKYSVPMSSQPKIDHSPEADPSMDIVFPSSRSETPLASFAPPSAALALSNSGPKEKTFSAQCTRWGSAGGLEYFRA
ncbi:hypothetical protein B0H14DRAFT_2563702 [Mycena olivaceomarginata]|nr:hypothetical protein B0H14DRAFT_2563702 [Mycena olivaceomarginata]